MTLDDLKEVALKCGLTKTNKNWSATEMQLEQFANNLLDDFKAIARDQLIQSIKRAADYEREQCAKVAEMAWFNGMEQDHIANAIRGRADE
jgi:hypothetical protein